jgi:hypothetical protein
MLSKDLRFSIDFERADYDARVAAAGQGIRQEKALPQVTFLISPLILHQLMFCFLCMVGQWKDTIPALYIIRRISTSQDHIASLSETLLWMSSGRNY